MNSGEVAQKARQGVAALGMRYVFNEGFGFVCSVLLARLLVPADFGIFAICMAVCRIFRMAGTLGLGAAIVLRRNNPPSPEQLRSLFTLQMLFCGVVVVVFWFAAPLLPLYYKSLNESHVFLIRALALGFLLTTARTIPSSLLERDMAFKQLAGVELAESVTSNVVAVLLAWAGLGVWGLAGAALVRWLVGLVVVYSMRPWIPGISFAWGGIRDMIRCGVSLQFSNALSVARELLYPVFVGGICGPVALGYVTWARTLAARPEALSEPYGRVALPMLVKLQDDPEGLTRALNKSIRLLAAFFLPLTGFMLGIGAAAIHCLYTDKWLPALPLFYYFCAIPAFVPLLIPLQRAVVAQGSARTISRLAMVTAVFEWGVGIPCVLIFGYLGAAIAVPLVALLTTLVYIRELGRSVRLQVWKPMALPLLHGLAAWMATEFIARHVATSIPTFLLAATLGLAVTAALTFVIQRYAAFEWISELRRALSKGQLVKPQHAGAA